MADFTNVIIGIQARSTSKRFPRKVFALLEGKPILQHVIDNCQRAVKHTGRDDLRNRRIVRAVLLIPRGDEIGQAFRHCGIPIFEGPEDDVLKRYRMMADFYEADYVVRVTADCPLLPDSIISKHINTATKNQKDYTSNVLETSRLFADGFDCEAISRPLLTFTDDHATSPYDREHVTPFMRRERPSWATIAHVIPPVDQSMIKYSIDTEEELREVNLMRKQYREKVARLEELDGKNSLFRF